MAKKTEKQIKVTLIKSKNGRLDKQQRTLEALGLHKVGNARVHSDTPVTRGMLAVVSHLVKVEEV